MKTASKIVSLVLLLGITATLLAGCGSGDRCCLVYDYYITVINDTPWGVFVDPFGLFLSPGDTMDIEIGPDYVRVVVLREFDGLVLADVDMVNGDVLVIQ